MADAPAPPSASDTVPATSQTQFDNHLPPVYAMDEIDFSAFDHVFGSGSYDFLDPLGDLDLQVDDAGGGAPM